MRVTPGRRRGIEILDDWTTPDDVRRRSMSDVRRANRWFGGRRAALRALEPAFAEASGRVTVVDVGTGLGDVPDAARHVAMKRGVALDVIGVDLSHALLRDARGFLDAAVVADVRRLPFRTAAIDVVMCSQLLHHFEDAAVPSVLAELHRTARRWVVISDIRRSWFAAIGFWLASLVLRFHPVTRRDGVTSVLRGFTVSELRAAVERVAATRSLVRAHPFWRVTAAWRVSTN